MANGLNNLAALYREMGDYAKAEPLLQQALGIWRTALGEQHPDVALSLNTLALLYSDIGDYAKAEPLVQQVLEMRRTALGEQHPDVALSLNNLAGLYREMGDYAKAEPLLQQALEIWRMVLGEQHPDVCTTLNNLADLYLATNRQNDAWLLVQRSTAIDDHLIQQMFSIGSERQRMAYLATLQTNFERFLSIVLQHFPLASEKVQAAFNLVLRRKAIGAEALAVQRDALLEGRYPDLFPLLQKLRVLREQIVKKSMAGPGSESPEVYQQTLVAWNTLKEQLEAQLAHQIPEMGLEQKLRDADRQAVAKGLQLRQDSALIEFIHVNIVDFNAVRAKREPQWKAARYLAFVLLGAEPNTVQLIDLGEAERIDQLISSFRTSITGEQERGRHVTLATRTRAQPTSGNEGTALRIVIFDSLVAALRGCKRLYLAPDGDLTRLPFEVLPTGNGERLIDIYRFSYLGVGRDALRFDAPFIRQPGESLIVADPAFDLDASYMPPQEGAIASRGRYSRDLDRRALHFSQLPGTREEGNKVAEMLEVQPLLAERAMEQELKTAHSPRILHIATHGFFFSDQQRDLTTNSSEYQTVSVTFEDKMMRVSRQENPLLRSGLALAGANTWLQGHALPAAAEDGLLTAEDVSGLDLSETELVVLSACETGLGEVRIGEGVFGLRRAFTIAGARRLIMSLWKVPDEQTQELMGLFYRSLLNGRPCLEALREAQLEMKAKHQNPYYWGAFIFQGDPGPLAS